MSDVPTEIHQAELRWTGQDQQGFSIVARSEGFDESIWQGRLLPIARPPDIKQTVTTVYKTFGAEAALIFRFLTRSADPEQPADAQSNFQPNLQHTRKDLITRALIGPIELLSPEVALMSSLIGCPDFLYPPPGHVAEKAVLPLLKPETLSTGLKTIPVQLDSLAQKDLELGLVITKALTEPMRPLTLQLPEDEVASPSAVALLWGLWRTTGPILTGLPGWQWSFSTGEAPLGETDPNPLPHLIVHRLRVLDDPLPTFERTERLVRLRAADAATGKGGETPTAQLLTVAYRSLRTEDFSGRVANLREYGITLAARVAAMPKEFREYCKPSPDVPALVPAAGPETPDPDDAPPAPEVSRREVPPASPRHEQPAARLSGVPWYEAVSHQSFLGVPQKADSFSDLFSQLTAGDENSALALERIRRRHELNQEPNDKERAHLRALMIRERWFIEQLANIPECEIFGSVRLLLDIVVEPDLADQDRRRELIREIWHWARNEQTPAVVILGLDDLSTKTSDYELQQALINAVGHRWRRDHGRYRLLRRPSAAESASGRGSHRAPRLLFFRDQQIPARWANAIVGICIIEMVVFAVLLAIHG